jgi:hypothetical protein
MKNLLLFCFLSIPFFASAQSDSSKNFLDDFIVENNAYIKSIYPIEKMQGVEIEVIYVKSLTKDVSSFGVRMSFTGRYTSTSTKFYSMLINEGELATLIAFLKDLTLKYMKERPSVYTEIKFDLSDGSQVGAYFSKNKWNPFIDMEKIRSGGTAYPSIENFNTLPHYLSQAQKKIEEIKGSENQ